MEDLSPLHDALPEAGKSNKQMETQNYYRPGASPRGGNAQRGPGRANSTPQRGPWRGSSIQRGPGRGNSTPQRGPGRGSLSQRGSGRGLSNQKMMVYDRPADNDKVWVRPERAFQYDPECEKKDNYSPKPKQSYEDDIKLSLNNSLNGSNSSPGRYNNKPHIKNTVDFKPSHIPAEMRFLPAPAGLKRYHREITSRDVIVVSDLFCQPDDKSIYKALLEEVESNDQNEWKLWHGDNHLISDDRKRCFKRSETFEMIIEKISVYFNMDVKATRFNWFRDTTDWKPYHHDAAALKPEKAAEQNFTVAVSFGVERDIAFQHAKTGTTISIPLPNGTMYTFSNDVNCIWRHGVPQVHPDHYVKEGRISVVAWGWAKGVVDVS